MPASFHGHTWLNQCRRQVAGRSQQSCRARGDVRLRAGHPSTILLSVLHPFYSLVSRVFLELCSHSLYNSTHHIFPEISVLTRSNTPIIKVQYHSHRLTAGGKVACASTQQETQTWFGSARSVSHPNLERTAAVKFRMHVLPTPSHLLSPVLRT